jgi:D-proline reductase (dithiol) PrdB
MGSYDELSLTNRLFMKGYPFSRYRIEPTPCAQLTKPLNQARVALVTTAGLYLPEQTRFEGSAMGDVSFREIPSDTDPQILLEAHKSNAFDHSGVTSDKNLAFPLDRFRELMQQGLIGELNQRHFSFMGSIIKPARLISETAPQVARALQEDRVDAVFLTPI